MFPDLEKLETEIGLLQTWFQSVYGQTYAGTELILKLAELIRKHLIYYSAKPETTRAMLERLGKIKQLFQDDLFNRTLDFNQKLVYQKNRPAFLEAEFLKISTRFTLENGVYAETKYNCPRPK